MAKIAAGFPAGVVLMHCSDTAPDGWLICNGASLLRVGIYEELFAVIGTNYGSADANHFNIPDMRGFVPVGKKSTDADFTPLGKTGGAKAHTLITAEMPEHLHPIAVTGSWLNAGATLVNTVVGGNTENTGNAGGDTAHNNLQPYITFNFIIRISGIPDFHYV